MFARIAIKRNAKDDGEKPFWISFADLMTALMVLFLLAMSVALLAVTRTVSEAEQRKEARDRDLREILLRLKNETDKFPGVKVDLNRGAVDFGDRARFDTGSSRISIDKAKLLREYVPQAILPVARSDVGTKWLKRVVVVGFADQRGTYLYNLDLSLQRSARLLCILLAEPSSDERSLSQDELTQIRDLFLVGGFSFNSSKKTLEESRRIELRLEFYALGEERLPPVTTPLGDLGKCPLAA
jgi:hypothetical protein